MSELIHPYSTSWPLAFSRIAAVLRTAITAKEVSIHHVGSTAVPDLPAKPIIDIDVVLPPEHTLEDMIAWLRTIGYTHHGDQGIPQREVFKRRQREEDHP
ncbi:MAG: GrpB family protein, partial [Bacteroidota bacterium]